MRNRQSVKFLQWLEYISRTRNNIVHAGNRRVVHLAGVKNVKVGAYCAATNEAFEYLVRFRHGCICMPNRHKRICKTGETLQNRYE